MKKLKNKDVSKYIINYTDIDANTDMNAEETTVNAQNIVLKFLGNISRLLLIKYKSFRISNLVILSGTKLIPISFKLNQINTPFSIFGILFFGLATCMFYNNTIKLFYEKKHALLSPEEKAHQEKKSNTSVINAKVNQTYNDGINALKAIENQKNIELFDLLIEIYHIKSRIEYIQSGETDSNGRSDLLSKQVLRGRQMYMDDSKKINNDLGTQIQKLLPDKLNAINIINELKNLLKTWYVPYFNLLKRKVIAEKEFNQTSDSYKTKFVTNDLESIKSQISDILNTTRKDIEKQYIH